MLGEIEERFNIEFFNKWQESTHPILLELEEGLNKITFTTEPQEIIDLKILIDKIKKQTSPTEYIKHINAIETLLKNIAHNYDFKDLAVNDFFFHSSVTIHDLANIMQINQYAKGYLHPIPKEHRKRPKVGFLQRHIAKQGAGVANQFIFEYFGEEKLALLEHHLKRLPDNIAITHYEKNNLRNTPSHLAERLGKNKYRQLQSQIEIRDFESANDYFSEQIYGNAFETYYIHIALLYDALDKIDAIAFHEGLQKKAELLNQFGLKKANSNTARQYLNQVAQNLGFEDASDLHQNYIHLNSNSEFERLRDLKQEFMNQAINNGDFADDPLEKIFNLTKQEYKRVSSKTKKENFLTSSSSYFSEIDHFQKLRNQITKLQRKKNLGEVFAKRKLAVNELLEKNQNIFSNMLMRAGRYLINNDTVKSYIDAFSLGLVIDNQLFEKRLKNIIKPIDEQFIDIAQSKIQARNDLINSLLKANMDEEEQIETLIVLQQNIQRCAKELESLDPERQLAKHQEKMNELIHLERQLQDYQTAYHFQEGKVLGTENKAQLDLRNNQAQDKINQIRVQIKNNTKTIKKLNAREAAQKRRDDSFPRIIRKWFANITKSVLGIKTPFYRQREQRIANWGSRVEELSLANQQLNIEKKLRKEQVRKLKSQIATIDEYQTQSATKLATDFELLAEELARSYQDIMTLYQDIALGNEDNETLLKAQEEFINREYRLNTLSQILSSKLHQGTFSVSELKELLAGVRNLKSSIKGLDPELITPFKDFNHPSLDLNLKILEARLETILLAEAKITIDKFLDDKDLKDPFAFLSTEHQDLTTNLSDENTLKLYRYIMTKYVATIRAESRHLNLKQLQDHYFEINQGYQSYHNIESPSVIEKKLANHYKNLLKEFEHLLESRFEALHHQELPAIQESLSELDKNLISYYRQNVESRKKTEAERATYYSYFWNAFGWFKTLDDVKKQENYALASQKQFVVFSNNYLKLLIHFTDNAVQHYRLYEPEKLNEEIIRLEDNLKAIEELLKMDDNDESPLPEIQAQYQRLLNIVKEEEEHHPNHMLTKMKREINQLAEEIGRLNNIANIIHKNVLSYNEFDTVAYQKYQEDYFHIRDQQRDLMNRVQELDAQNKRLGVSYAGFDKQKNKLDAKLDLCQQEIVEHLAQYNDELQLYNNVVQHHNITLDKHSTLGKGLRLAIVYQNKEAIDQILDSSAEIELSDVRAALKLAAKNGQTEIFEKILLSQYKHNFLDKDLSECLYTTANKEIAYLILSNMDIKLNSDLAKHLKDFLLEDNTDFTIKRALIQTVIPEAMHQYTDTDSVILKNIREGFIMQKQILDSLMDEYKKIKAKQQESIEKEQPLELAEINAFFEKIERARQIREELNAPYLNQKFVTKARKKEHLKKWKNEIDRIENFYIKGIAPHQVERGHTAITFDEEMKRVAIEPSFAQNFAEKEKFSATELSEGMTEPHGLGIEEAPISHFEQTAFNSLLEIKDRFNRAKNKVEKHLKAADHFGIIVDQLTIMKQNLTHDEEERYQEILTRAINLAAQKNKLDELKQLLSLVDQPEHRAKYQSQALFAGLSAGHVPIVDFLFERQAYLGKEEEFLQELLDIPNKGQAREYAFQKMNFPKFSYTALTHIPIPVDQHISQLIDSLATQFEQKKFDDEKWQSTIPPVTRNWVRDKDAPHLMSIRNGYILQEKMFNDSIIQLEELFDHFEEELNDEMITKESIEEYRKRISDLRSLLQHKNETVSQLIENIYRFKLDSIDKEPRLREYREKWEQARQQTENRVYEKIFKLETTFGDKLKIVEAELGSPERKSYFPSQANVSEQTVEETSSEKKPRPKPHY